MGAENVKATFGTWGRLPDRAFRALVYMVNRTYDRPTDGKPPRTFWGGREELAVALGVTVPPRPGQDVPQDVRDKVVKARKSAFKVTDKVVAILVSEGAIERIREPRSGIRAEYRLLLDPFQRGAEDPSTRGAEDPSRGGSMDPSSGGPKEEQRNHTGTSREEEHAPEVTTSPVPVDDAPPAAPTDPEDLLICGVCGWQAWEGHASNCTAPIRTKEPAL